MINYNHNNVKKVGWYIVKDLRLIGTINNIVIQICINVLILEYNIGFLEKIIKILLKLYLKKRRKILCQAV